jgi:hypothetical protein
MKQLKLAVLAVFTLALVSNVNAQDENNPWAVTFGVNAIDFLNGSASFGDQIKDYLGASDWNIMPSITRIAGEKYLDKGFSLQLAGSINQIDKTTAGNVSQFFFWSVDMNVKYDLNNLVGDTGWFDPYVLLGGGYTEANSLGEGMFNYGLGYNIWLSENLGINYQTMSRVGFANKIAYHAQHSVG